MYTPKSNHVTFDFREDVIPGNSAKVSERISRLRNFCIEGINFQVARTPVPLKLNISASTNGEKFRRPMDELLDLDQVQEYILTGKDNEFLERYRESQG